MNFLSILVIFWWNFGQFLVVFWCNFGQFFGSFFCEIIDRIVANLFELKKCFKFQFIWSQLNQFLLIYRVDSRDKWIILGFLGFLGQHLRWISSCDPSDRSRLCANVTEGFRRSLPVGSIGILKWFEDDVDLSFQVRFFGILKWFFGILGWMQIFIKNFWRIFGEFLRIFRRFLAIFFGSLNIFWRYFSDSLGFLRILCDSLDPTRFYQQLFWIFLGFLRISGNFFWSFEHFLTDIFRFFGILRDSLGILRDSSDRTRIFLNFLRIFKVF